MAKDFDTLWEEWMADSNWSSPVVQSDSKPVVTPSTSFIDWDEWLASQPTSIEEDEDKDLVPQLSPKTSAPVSKTASSTISKSFSIKAFTAFMAIIILIASMCITAHMNHKVNEANQAASEILSSAQAECKEICNSANEEASEKVEKAKTEAEKIKEETK